MHTILDGGITVGNTDEKRVYPVTFRIANAPEITVRIKGTLPEVKIVATKAEKEGFSVSGSHYSPAVIQGYTIGDPVKPE